MQFHPAQSSPSHTHTQCPLHVPAAGSVVVVVEVVVVEVVTVVVAAGVVGTAVTVVVEVVPGWEHIVKTTSSLSAIDGSSAGRLGATHPQSIAP
jgi:hypothetical protein